MLLTLFKGESGILYGLLFGKVFGVKDGRGTSIGGRVVVHYIIKQR